MSHDATVQEVLAALDQMEQEVTVWEATFLESLLHQSYPLTPKQYAVLVKMAEKYVAETGLVAELYGQQRLLER
jgi:hypothetical protein